MVFPGGRVGAFSQPVPKTLRYCPLCMGSTGYVQLSGLGLDSWQCQSYNVYTVYYVYRVYKAAS